MKEYLLSDKELQLLQSIIKFEIDDLTNTENGFFEDLFAQNISIKDYIDERINIAEKFGIDFWGYVRLSGNDFSSNRLIALYKQIPLQDFIDNYEFPKEITLAKNLLIDLLDYGKNKKP